MTDDTTRAVLARYTTHEPDIYGRTNLDRTVLDHHAMAARIAELERENKQIRMFATRAVESAERYVPPAGGMTTGDRYWLVHERDYSRLKISCAMQEATHD